MFFDSHAHLTSPQVSHVDALIARALKAGVSHMVNICTDQATLEKGLLLPSQYPHIYNAAATTPHDVASEGESFFPIVEQLAQEKKLVAIGETGLDYHYEHSPKETQKKYLVQYLHLAKKMDLPIIIHCRDAFADLFEIADREYQGRPLLLHCFTGTLEEAYQALDRNWMLSFSGIITFKKSTSLQETLKKIPLKHILVETDTPYLAPQSKRGHPNEPAFLTETVAFLATLRGITLEEAANVTFQNAHDFFCPSEL